MYEGQPSYGHARVSYHIYGHIEIVISDVENEQRIIMAYLHKEGRPLMGTHV